MVATVPGREPVAPATPQTLARCIRRLHELLEAEARALRAAALAEIESLVQAKADLFGEIAQITAETQASISPELGAELAACQRLNQENGAFIAIRRRHNDRLLRLMHGLPPTDTLYDARGRAQSATPGRHRAFV